MRGPFYRRVLFGHKSTLSAEAANQFSKMWRLFCERTTMCFSACRCRYGLEIASRNVNGSWGLKPPAGGLCMAGLSPALVHAVATAASEALPADNNELRMLPPPGSLI